MILKINLCTQNILNKYLRFNNEISLNKLSVIRFKFILGLPKA